LEITNQPYGKIILCFILPYSQDQRASWFSFRSSTTIRQNTIVFCFAIFSRPTQYFVYGKINFILICRTFPLVGCLLQQALSCLCFLLYCRVVLPPGLRYLYCPRSSQYQAPTVSLSTRLMVLSYHLRRPMVILATYAVLRSCPPPA